MAKLEALLSQIDQRTADAIRAAMDEALYKSKTASHGKVPRHIEEQLIRIESELQSIREHYDRADFNKTERYESTKKLVIQSLKELDQESITRLIQQASQE